MKNLVIFAIKIVHVVCLCLCLAIYSSYCPKPNSSQRDQCRGTGVSSLIWWSTSNMRVSEVCNVQQEDKIK